MNLPEARRQFETTLGGAVDFLRRLVQINSFTANPEGIEQNVRLVRERLEPMGFSARRGPGDSPENAPHLILTRPGPGPRVLLISHLDTVYSPEEERENDFVWREEGGRLFGPGVADIKGGTTLIAWTLEGLQRLDRDRVERLDWTLLFNGAEERGSRTFAELARTLAPGAAACLGFEPGYPGTLAGGTVVVARKGSARFTLRIHGRPAHSGSHPERGASAIVEMADKIVKIAGLADYDRGVTTNVGTVRGGTVVNTVPAYAEALIDLRARDAASFEAAKQSIRQVCAESIVRSRSDGFACRLELEEHPDYPPMPRNRATDRLFEWAREDSEAVGAAVEPQERGGASDASHVCALAPTIDGLGPVGDHAHSSQPGRQEFILRSSLVPRALLAASLLSRIAG